GERDRCRLENRSKPLRFLQGAKLRGICKKRQSSHAVDAVDPNSSVSNNRLGHIESHGKASDSHRNHTRLARMRFLERDGGSGRSVSKETSTCACCGSPEPPPS